MLSNKSLVPTPQEERMRYTAAVAGELEKTLEAVDGVIDARVHLVLSQGGGPAGDRVTAEKASVLLKYTAGRDGAPPMTEQEIASVVAGAVDGLDAANVAVVQSRVFVPLADGQRAGNASVHSRYFKMGIAALSVLVLVLAVALVLSRVALRKARTA